MKDVLRKYPKNKILLFLIAFISLPILTQGQEYHILDSIQIRSHLKFLASDAMQGRETGTEGQKKVADYLQYYMKSNGLIPLDNEMSYYQKFVLSSVAWDTIALRLDDVELIENEDFVAPPYPNSSTDLTTNRLVYLGYGIDDDKYSDYQKNKVQGKSILIREGEPMMNESQYLITGSDTPSAWSAEEKLKLARIKGVESIFIITEDIKNVIRENRSTILYNRLIIDSVAQVTEEIPPYTYISQEWAERLMGKRINKISRVDRKAVKTGKLRAVKLKVNSLNLYSTKEINHIFTENIVGLLEGQMPPEEGYIVVSAHYDHLGVRGNSIYNGADDNGSGTAAVLAMIQEFVVQSAHGEKPIKPILFIFMTAEEKGLLGSRYYVDNPLLPLRQAYANVNIDMIGRVDEYHDNPSYIYVIGADKISTGLDELVKTVNEASTDSVTLELDYRYNADDDPHRFYYRSDHYNFAQNGIPVVFFFSGVHEDYHMPSDTEDKILYTPLTRRAQFIFEVIKAAAYRTSPFLYDVHE